MKRWPWRPMIWLPIFSRRRKQRIDAVKKRLMAQECSWLDDYEEGTWTPTVPTNGLQPNIPAHYILIGQMVIVHQEGRSVVHFMHGLPR